MNDKQKLPYTFLTINTFIVYVYLAIFVGFYIFIGTTFVDSFFDSFSGSELEQVLGIFLIFPMTLLAVVVGAYFGIITIVAIIHLRLRSKTKKCLESNDLDNYIKRLRTVAVLDIVIGVLTFFFIWGSLLLLIFSILALVKLSGIKKDLAVREKGIYYLDE